MVISFKLQKGVITMNDEEDYPEDDQDGPSVKNEEVYDGDARVYDSVEEWRESEFEKDEWE